MSVLLEPQFVPLQNGDIACPARTFEGQVAGGRERRLGTGKHGVSLAQSAKWGDQVRTRGHRMEMLISLMPPFISAEEEQEHGGHPTHSGCRERLQVYLQCFKVFVTAVYRASAFVLKVHVRKENNINSQLHVLNLVL